MKLKRSRELTPQRCRPTTIDTWLQRSRIAEQIARESPHFSGTLLDVGCGDMPYRGLLLGEDTKVERYIGLDLEGIEYGSTPPDLVWDGRRIPLADCSVDCAIATELLEHCPDPEAVLREIERVLVPGGLLLATVPFLWPLHDVPHDEYRFTPFSLERHVVNARLTVIRLEALGGWDSSLAQMIGLWTRRRAMPHLVRAFLSTLAWPVVCGLATLDSGGGDFRSSSVMITGLTCKAMKPLSKPQTYCPPDSSLDRTMRT